MAEPQAVQDTVRPMRADARRNRERIMEAAREVFAGENPDVGIDEIARRAGVGVGTVYRHFPDKQALMGELVRRRFLLFNASMRAAIADEEAEPFDALRAVLRENLFAMARDAATRTAFMAGGEGVFAYAATEAEEFLELAAVLVDRAHAAGTLRPDFQAQEVPMLMCGICATIDVSKPGWSWERLLDFVLAGIAAPG